MKLSLTLLLSGAFFFVLLTSMITSDPLTGPAGLKVDITPIEGLRVQVEGQNETGKKLYLSVVMIEPTVNFSTTETEIFAETFPADVSTFSRTLNLSKLESGNYRIDVKAGKHRFSRPLEIKAKRVVEDDRVIAMQ